MKIRLVFLLFFFISCLPLSFAQSNAKNKYFSAEIRNAFNYYDELFSNNFSNRKNYEPSSQPLEQWTSIGPNSPSSKLRLHIDKYRNMIFASSSEGFWYSQLNNIQWTQREDTGWIGRQVWSLATHASVSGRIINGRENAFFKGYLDLTNDWGLSFMHLYNSQGGAVNDIKNVPLEPNTFYACTWSDIADGELLKSTDGGISWTLFGNTIHHAKTEIAADNNNANIVYVSGSSGVIKTTDGGANWFSSSNGIPPDRGVYCMAMNHANTNIIIASTDSGLHKTTNGGANWFYVSHNFVARHFAVNPLNPNFIVGVTFNPNNVIYSVNGGATWDLFSPQLNVAYKRDVGFSPDGAKLFTLTEDNGVYSINVENYVPVELVSFTASVIAGEIVLDWKTSGEKNNFGFEVERAVNNWATIGFVKGAGTTTEESHYSFVDKFSDAANQTVKYRLKQIDLNGAASYSEIIEVKIYPPEFFVLHQNYPNPFNPTTTIKFSIPSLSFRERVSEGRVRATLKVFDILGNEVATLVDEEKEPGVYEVEFPGVETLRASTSHSNHATSLSSGIYFYNLQAGAFVQTRKMVLLR